jgi:hypothetical protein
MSIRAILYNTNFSSIKFTPLCFRYINAMLSRRVSFLFLLVFVLLVVGGEFDSYAIHAHVILLREGARTSFISAAS